MLTYKVRRAKRWNNGNPVPITMSGFTKEQYIGAARLIARDPHFPQPPMNSINFQIQNLLPESSLSPLRNRGINLPSGCPADHHLLAECTGIRVLHCRNTTK